MQPFNGLAAGRFQLKYPAVVFGLWRPTVGTAFAARRSSFANMSVGVRWDGNVARKNVEKSEEAEWRKLAKQMRAFAKETRHPEAKQMMLSMALAYDGLVERAEERRRKK